MNAILAIFIVTVTGMGLMAYVMIVALRRSRTFKASARIGRGSFDIESKQ